MSSNKDGLNGLDIEQIAIEKVILVGVQAPNIKPAVRFDKNGKSLPKIEIDESGGAKVKPFSGYTCGSVDTSWINPLGIFNLIAGNKINLTAGTGGFEWVTAGPSKFNVAIQDFTCTHGFIVNTRLFSVASTERTHFMGPRIDFEYDETYFTGRINFLSNVCMAGSLFVNGELYCTHITTQQQQNQTEPSAEMTGYINPNSAFSVLNGKSSNSVNTFKGIDFGKLSISHPFDVPISIRIDVERLLPGIGSLINLKSAIVEVPCLIRFVEGIALCSDCLIKNNKNSLQFLTQIKTGILEEDETSDFYGGGHRHIFYGPSTNYKKSTADFYKEAAKTMSSLSPTPAKPCVPNGGDSNSIQDVKNIFINAAKQDMEKWGKSMAERFTPKWLKKVIDSVKK